MRIHVSNSSGLKLTIEGEAESKWTESSGSSKSQTTFLGNEQLLEHSYYVFGSKDSENCVTIATGIHNYDFVFQLPPNLPYSVEGKHGHVRYKVKANLDIPWAFDLQDEKMFTVVRNDDVNALIDNNLPIEMEEFKTFCCWCCKSDPLALKVRLLNSGFSAGGKIAMNVQINNQSSKTVENSIIELKRIHQFTSLDPIRKIKEHKETMIELDARGAINGENVNFDVIIELPASIPISNQKFCKVYQISYELKLVAETEGLSVSPHIIVPITIGSEKTDLY